MTDLRKTLHAFVEAIADAIEHQAAVQEWVDQTSSPLGRDRHMRLVRNGTLPGKKDGRRVLVRRVDIERYLATKTVTKSDPAAELEREAVRILNEHQRKSA